MLVILLTTKNIETLDITMFFKLLIACPSYSIYRMLKVPQGTGRIFEEKALKNLHLFHYVSSLPNFFRLVFSFRQAEQTKNGVKLLDLNQQLYQPNRQFFRSKYDSFSIQINAMWGLAPTRLASTHTQKQGE